MPVHVSPFFCWPIAGVNQLGARWTTRGYTCVCECVCVCMCVCFEGACTRACVCVNVTCYSTRLQRALVYKRLSSVDCMFECFAVALWACHLQSSPLSVSIVYRASFRVYTTLVCIVLHCLQRRTVRLNQCLNYVSFMLISFDSDQKCPVRTGWKQTKIRRSINVYQFRFGIVRPENP